MADMLDAKWQERFIDLAHQIAKWSKDPSTKCGSVIVRPNRTICSTGYNGFPMGVEDSEHLLNDRDEKLERTVHAEVNAIVNAATSVHGCTLFVVPMMPCPHCAALMIQCGIARVIYEETATLEQLQRWKDRSKISQRMFVEREVKLERFMRN